MTNIRKPGMGWDLSDEELIAAPARLLTAEQRKRRRYLKRLVHKKKDPKRQAKIKYCQGYKKNGEACRGPAVTGAKHCRGHLNEAERAKLGMKPMSEVAHEAAVKRSQAKINASGTQILHSVVETAVEKLIGRQFEAIGLEFVGFNEEGNPVVIDHGAARGVTIHGESKDGDINMTDYPDYGAQFQMIEKLMDRVHGRPRQTTILEGGTKPVRVEPVRTVDRAKEVAGILQRSHALPSAHEGRRRIASSETQSEESRI